MKTNFYRNIIVSLIFLLITINTAKADIFRYTTSVYFNDVNAIEAKSGAISLGRMISLSYVIKKITLMQDSKKLSKLITPKLAMSLNVGFNISNETITKGGYQADITYNFSDKLIKEFLKKNNISYVTERLSNYLISPDIDSVSIVDDNIKSFWRSMWQNIIVDSYLSNITYFSPDNENVFTSNTYINNLQQSLQISDLFRVTLYKNDNSYSASIYSVFYKNKTTTKNFESMDDLFSEIIQIIEEPLKIEYLNRFSSVSTTTPITITFNNIQKWAHLYKVLTSIDGITSTKITEMGNKYVKLDIAYNIPIDKIANYLEKKGIYFDLSTLVIASSNSNVQNLDKNA